MRIATGEEHDDFDTAAEDDKDKTAQEMGRNGGRARAYK